MSSEQISFAREELYVLLKEVRKEAVPLVDAFDFPDKVLNSALGRSDGDVYNHLYKWALKAPRNKKQVRPCSSVEVVCVYVCHCRCMILTTSTSRNCSSQSYESIIIWCVFLLIFTKKKEK